MNRPVLEEYLRELAVIVESGAFTNGPHVGAFETAFANYCGVEHCVGVSSGLDALRLALHALGIGEGDEVIVPANTFLATYEAISQVGAIPVAVDVTEVDYNIDVAAVEAAISSRTRALMPVDLYGQMSDMLRLGRVAVDHGLVVVEDACQAHGAIRDGIRAGAAGNAAAFSFYPGKNLGAFGDAGALVTNEEHVATQVRALREHGQVSKYKHELVGYTARLDTVQAAALLLKLPQLDMQNAQRQEIAKAYTSVLEGIGDLGLPPVAPGSEPVWHLYEIRTGRRDALAEHLRQRGIGTGLHYPQPAPLALAYAHLGYTSGSFPVSEALARELLSLPMFPGITDEQVTAVSEGIRSFFDRGS